MADDLVKRAMPNVPHKEGFYWGKWRIKADGTADENEPPGDEWEVMHVVENCLDESDPEYLMVMVPGVKEWQPLENFVWGAAVSAPGEKPAPLVIPRVVDNDAGEITVSLQGKELRGWEYHNQGEHLTKMLAAREYVEGFCDGRRYK